ncbi:nucleotidyltransferase family protein [Streptomyces pathocidini]|uniref:nucleotidyltransferase family protein n=1 Tax=Streptomyces pathocidini TaxID=1650571 RepID=UPI0033C33464
MTPQSEPTRPRTGTRTGTGDDRNPPATGADRNAPVAGLLLAAGAGRRLGGHPKALLDHDGRPLIEHAVRVLREGGCDPVHVVLGASADTVRERVRLTGCVLVDNPDWAQGMGSSLQRGLASLAATDSPAALVALVDQPGIGPEAVARVAAAYASPSTLAAASYDGRRGHPVLFGADHWSGVAASATGDQGARAYLQRHAAQLRLIDCSDIAAPDDIDTPEDLKRAGLGLGTDRPSGRDTPPGTDTPSG